MFTSIHILVLPLESEGFKIYGDASRVGLRVVVMYNICFEIVGDQ